MVIFRKRKQTKVTNHACVCVCARACVRALGSNLSRDGVLSWPRGSRLTRDKRDHEVRRMRWINVVDQLKKSRLDNDMMRLRWRNMRLRWRSDEYEIMTQEGSREEVRRIWWGGSAEEVERMMMKWRWRCGKGAVKNGRIRWSKQNRRKSCWLSRDVGISSHPKSVA